MDYLTVLTHLEQYGVILTDSEPPQMIVDMKKLSDCLGEEFLEELEAEMIAHFIVIAEDIGAEFLRVNVDIDS